MKRKNLAFAMIALLLFSLLSGAAGAEEPVPATPTDLVCAHEHTKTTIYFYDGPIYTSLDAESHKVSGPATVETVCLDCGEILSDDFLSDAEEIRPHSMKKGSCVLCGYRQKTNTISERPTENASERTVIARAAGADYLQTLTLTKADLNKLKKENVATLLVRGSTGSSAVALSVEDMLDQTERAGADLTLQMTEWEDGSFFAGLFLVSGHERIRPESAGITLRFYRQIRSDVRVSLAPADEDTLIDTQGTWDEQGFWSVPYIEEGTYFLLQ